MATIDFPLNPIAGQNYDFDGIRYTWVDGTPDGHWEVSTPGSYGKATAAEVDAGIDDNKFITPEALANGDEYARISDAEVIYEGYLAGKGGLYTGNNEVWFSDPTVGNPAGNYDGIVFDDNTDIEAGVFNFHTDKTAAGLISAPYGNAQINAGTLRGNSALVLAGRNDTHDVSIRASRNGALENVVVAQSTATDTFAELYHNGNRKAFMQDYGMYLDGELRGATNIGSYLYNNSNYPDSQLTDKTFCGSTSTGVDAVEFNWSLSGNSATISGYISINYTAKTFPNDNSTNLKLSFATMINQPDCPISGWTGSTFGTGSIWITGGVGVDFGMEPIRARVVSDESITFETPQISIRSKNADFTLGTADEARIYFSAVVRGVLYK